MPKDFEIEKLVDSLATISSIIFHRLQCMECNQCEPCGPAFMKALNTLREAGNVQEMIGAAPADAGRDVGTSAKGE
jgi:predicted aldo/keto reductase-like oxidoreductase